MNHVFEINCHKDESTLRPFRSLVLYFVQCMHANVVQTRISGKIIFIFRAFKSCSKEKKTCWTFMGVFVMHLKLNISRVFFVMFNQCKTLNGFLLHYCSLVCRSNILQNWLDIYAGVILSHGFLIAVKTLMSDIHNFLILFDGYREFFYWIYRKLVLVFCNMSYQYSKFISYLFRWGSF